MEEDIKELAESIKEAYRCYDYDLDYNPLSKGIAEMIDHLIKAYKEIKEIEESHRKENGELRERVKHLEVENEDLKNLANNKQWLSPCYVAQNYIPVSLVKEKIEEKTSKIKYLNNELEKAYKELEEKGTETEIDMLEAYIYNMETENTIRDNERKAYEELLEKRK